MTFAHAANALNVSLKAVAGTAVTYRRQGASVTLTDAVKGRSEFQVESLSGAIERFETVDWLLPASSLVLSGSVTLPQRGDRIEETQGNTTYHYDVTAPTNEAPYQFSDTGRQRLRIHSEQVKVV